MSVIKPFKGWRPGVDIVQKLASRPYDVLNTEEARKECEASPVFVSLLSFTISGRLFPIRAYADCFQ